MATARPSSPDGGEDFPIAFEQEEDGRWLSEIEQLPGVMACGLTRAEAKAVVLELALRVLSADAATPCSSSEA